MATIMKNFIKKIQNLPESKKKIILWSVVAAIGLVLILLFVISLPKRLAGFQNFNFREKINFQPLERELGKIEIPEIVGQELQSLTASKDEEIENMIKELEAQESQTATP